MHPAQEDTEDKSVLSTAMQWSGPCKLMMREEKQEEQEGKDKKEKKEERQAE